MKLTWSKRIAIWMSILSVLGLGVCAYAEYEQLRTSSDVAVYRTPDAQMYRLKSTHWLFDRYQKALLSDDEVGLGKLPAPAVSDLLAFKPVKFLLLSLALVLAIWIICTSSGWFFAGLSRPRTK